MTLTAMGRRIKQRREALGMTAEELAEQIGRTRGYISRLENGKAGEALSDLLAVARALGTTLADLVGETDEALLAEVRRRLPAGSDLALGFERIARGLPEQTQSDQEFIRQAIDVLAARWGRESETTAAPEQ